MGELLNFRQAYNELLKIFGNKIPLLTDEEIEKEISIFRDKIKNVEESTCEELIDSYFHYKKGQLSSPL